MTQQIILPPSGTYVLAVSGGIDSMVLLDVMRRHGEYQLIVAHVNHGIRDDSHKDELLVKEYCQQYSIDCEVKRLSLGVNTSEADARAARYAFLHQLMQERQADAIITAHHRDDVIETAIINLLRGTGYRGLTSLKNNVKVKRPFINIQKDQLIAYAGKHDVPWREDSTNVDQTYLRNYIRHTILPKLSDELLQKFHQAIDNQRKIDPLLKQEIDGVLQHVIQEDSLVRERFVQLPHDVATEAMRQLLGHAGMKSIDRTSIERAVHFAKTGLVHKKLQLPGGFELVSQKKSLSLVSPKI